MTVKELSQLYWLKKEIRRDQERLEELRVLARSPSGPNLSGMKVQGGKQESKLEKIVLQIVELEEMLSEKQIRSIEQQLELERYIETIPESYLRTIFGYRFIDGMTWPQIAIQMSTTEDSVKKACYRYIRKNK